MKALRGKLSNLQVRRKKSTGEHDGAETGDAASSPGTPAAPMTPPMENMSRSATPVHAPAGMMVKTGPPPPGAKIMKGPPPPGAMPRSQSPPAAFFSAGQGGSTPPGRGVVRPPSTSPPPGAKIMSGPPPPGAKIMSGPPPGNAKLMHGPPSPSKGPPVKMMMGGPVPAGAKKMMVPPLQGMATSPVRTPMKMPPGGLPPGAKVVSGPPPGAKIMHGAPPPGARIVKAPMSRPLTPESSVAVSKSPVFVMAGGSRPATPEFSIVGGHGGGTMPSPPSVAGMKKIIAGPPPPGARLVKMPGGGTSPPLRAVSPPRAPSPSVGRPTTSPLVPAGNGKVKMQMRLSPSRPDGAVGSHPPSPHLIQQNASFSHPPPPGSPGKQQLLRPMPVRSKVVPGGAPSPSSPPSATFSPAALPGQSAQHSDVGTDEVQFQEEGDGDIDFKEASPVQFKIEEQSPRGGGKPARGAPSSNSSTMFREEADIQTAPPPPGTARNKSPSANSIQSSSIRAQNVTSQPPSQAEKETKRRTKSGDEKKSKSRRKRSSRRRRHHRSSSDSASSDDDDDEEDNEEKERNGRASRKESRRRRRRDKTRDDGDSGSSSGSNDQFVDREGLFRHGSGGSSSYAPQFSQDALTTTALTPPLRSRIADQFLSILCPQQYYGKVRKINGIRPLNPDRSQATGLRKHNCIYVATKGVTPNQYFFPQLRLYEADGKPTVDNKDRGALDTPIILYEAAPGNMLFAETELEAQRLLDTNRNADSCFVLAFSAILFRNPEQYVLPLAILNVRWIPYASPKSEPQCPVHHKELQLFDPYSKELVCALCASKESDKLSKLVVIPDVLKGDSRRKIQESVSRQLDEAQHTARKWVGQHQRLNHLCSNKKEAVNQQFDLLVAAVDAKRKEFLEACDAEYALAQSDLAREILVADERVQLLSAATDHLHTDGSHPLYSMQIATIAEGLESSKQLSSTLSKRALNFQNITNSVVPNLEGAMAELQSLSPNDDPAPQFGRTGSGRAASHSPFQTRSRGRTDDSVAVTPGRSPYGTPRTRHTGYGSQQRSVSAAQPSSRARRAVHYEDQPRRSVSTGAQRGYSVGQNGGSPSSRSRARLTPQHSPNRLPPPLPSPGSTSSRRHSESRRQRRLDRDSDSRPPQRDEDGVLDAFCTDAVTVPNSTGTSLFDYPVDELLHGDVDGGPSRLRKPVVIQWAVRVEDPGDWVGIGVGVGTTIDEWERGRSNDLSHLWIVPGHPTGSAPDRQVYKLRVTVTTTVGHARLSIHDARGRQLDDGSIPQWNASRVCYPQVTFGGRIGQVRMIESPHRIS